MKSIDAISKRDTLHGIKKTSSENLSKIAQSFVEKEQFSDAIDFLKNKPSDLKALRQKFLETGDTFLFLKASNYLKDDPNFEQDLLECSKKAEKLGKIRYAISGFEKLENEAEINRLKAVIADDADQKALIESEVFIPEHVEDLPED